MAEPAADFELIGVVDLPSEDTITIDEATDRIFDVWKWPRVGGPSGRGWSYWSSAMTCGEYFRRLHETENPPIEVQHDQALQIGALFHTLEALYYGGGLGNAYVLPNRGGLVSDLVPMSGRRPRWKVPPTAADDLVAALKAMCDEAGLPAPRLDIVLEAARCFDVHTNWWDRREDVTPLGVEIFARHPRLNYTCRYDLIARVGNDDPLIPPGVYVFEKKTTKWIDEMYLEGWGMDGEILGEFLCWEESGMRDIFGPLNGIVMDVVSKGKTVECRRVVLPPRTPLVAKHERLIKLQAARVEEWRAIGWFPQNFASCYRRGGRCSQWSRCAAGLDGVDE